MTSTILFFIIYIFYINCFPLNGNLSIVLEPNFCGQGSGCITCAPAAKAINITCGMYSDVPVPTNTLIYNINTRYAPQTRKSLYGIAQRDNQIFMAQLVIDTDGSIKYYGSLGDGSCDLMFFTGTYYYG